MRVRFYTESFKPYLSGVTVSVDTFAKGLTELGHEVTVCAPGYPDFTENDTYKVFRFPSLGTPLYPGFRLAIPFSQKHKQLPLPDIIHSHSPYQLGYMSQALAKKKKIPFVYHFHTLFTEYLHFVPLPQAISRPIVINIIRSFCKNCDLIITPTDIVKDVLVNEYKVTQRIEVLPTGVEDAAVAKATPQGIREKYGIPSEAFVLEYCGRLSKEKNIEFLLQAFKDIVAVAPHTRLLIVAFGPHENALKELARTLGIVDKVIFTGRVERDRIYDHLKAGDLFVCASKTETQGLVVSEAKACGKPAVGINAQGVGRMIEHNIDGLLVPDDKAAFVAATLSLINNREKLAALAKGALKNAQEKYFTSAITKKLVALYNSL